jgi:hypothetical protein
MGLSRKRRHELKRLRGTASELWDEQREVLDRATKVLSEVGRQLADLGREEVAPRVREAIDNRVVPGIASGLTATKDAARVARDRVAEKVAPAVTGALGSAAVVAELARDPQVRKAIARVGRKGAAVAAPAARSVGPLRVALMGLGVVVVIGVVYTAWQALRADEEAWVGDEAEGVEEPDEA